MKPVIDITSTVLGQVERAFALLAGIAIMILMVIVCAEVAGRSALNQPIRGNIDMVAQLMAFCAAGGIAYSQRRFGNVRMTVFSGRLTGRAKWLSEILSTAIAAWVIYILARGCWAYLVRSWNSGADTPEIGIPIWIGISFVLASLALLLLRLILQLVEAIRLLFDPVSPSTIFATYIAQAAPPAKE
ncbi:MAG: TRAP transporter small permease subunit [Rhodobacterales bacterium]